MKTFKITPSLYMCDTTKIFDEIKKLKEAGIDHLHFDVMDGQFVNNYAFGPKILDDIKKHFSEIEIDSHIMANNLNDKVELFKNSDYITFHINSLQNEGIENLIKNIKSLGCKVGIALDLENNVNDIKKYIKDIDLITIMSIKSGFSGQIFNESTWFVIDEVVQYKNLIKPEIKVQIDGGVRWNNIKKLIDSKIDWIVVGSLLFGEENYNEVIKKIENLK
ncbi:MULTISPECIES: ribulose-phosphate 3-epimerase [Mesoplasma]|uniref:Ribulose phosphate epimerase n=1 Tax=Mesoplasma florum TaxID=2151 RepID=A0A2R3P7B1_MESFO|nr:MULTISPECIES: ribulose-phosphate 3-epimerase [Mesoplasma]AVN64373.1 ribulose phosphate epimerase [Mesoplasma florum]